MSTLWAGFYLTEADIEDPYKPLFAGSNGRFGNSWASRMARLRCALNPAAQAASPTPPHRSTNRPLPETLAWATGLNTKPQNFYFETSPGALRLLSTQAGTTFNQGPLSYGTTYYWRIDTVGPCAITTGPVWSFSTAAAPRSALLGCSPPLSPGARPTLSPWRDTSSMAPAE